MNKQSLLITIFISLSGLSAMAEERARDVTKKEEYEVETYEEKEFQGVRAKKKLGTLIVFDHSGSMGATIDANKEAVRTLMTKLPTTEPIGLIPFSGCYTDDSALHPPHSIPLGLGRNHYVLSRVQNLQAGGDTDLFRALRVAKEIIQNTKDFYADIALFTDSQDTCGGQNNWQQLLNELKVTQEIYNYKGQVKKVLRTIKIHVITEATGAASVELKSLAAKSGGKYAEAKTLGEKIQALKKISDHSSQATETMVRSLDNEEELATEEIEESESVEKEKAVNRAKAGAKAKARQKKTRDK